MHILLVFLDGIGLGDDDPDVNPFAVAGLPTLQSLSNHHRWVRGTGTQHSERAAFIPTDACLGVPGRPQSATGQAAIVTGRNIPQIIGEHYGPKPNEAIRQLLTEDNFFIQVVQYGKTATLLEAYPPRWHQGIVSGKRLPASYQYAVQAAGLPFWTADDYLAGRAMSGDWTGEGWQQNLGFNDTPLYTPYEAGVRMVELSRSYDFAFFSHWMTDVVGHRGPLEHGIQLLETFDSVMQGALDAWDDSEGVMIITSDHGNMESLNIRTHTENNVPTVIIGAKRDEFVKGFNDLTGFVPRMANLLFE